MVVNDSDAGYDGIARDWREKREWDKGIAAADGANSGGHRWMHNC